MWIEKSNSVTSIDCVLNVEVTKDNNIHIFDIIQLENEPNILKESLTKQAKQLSWDRYGDSIVDRYSSLLKAD
jgi:hypothetical protein